MTPTAKRKHGLLRTIFSRALHTYFLTTRGLTLGVRAIVRTDDGKFLLVRHTYTPGWHFPGGGVEKGETAEDAVSNELQQETGLKLCGKPILHGVFHNSDVSKRDHVLAFLCEVEGDLQDRPISMEVAEVDYFGIDNLPQGTDPGTLRRMQEIVDGKRQSQGW